MSSANGHAPAPAHTPAPPPAYSASQPPPEPGLRAFGELLRRRWFIVALAAIAVPLAALAFSLSQEKVYSATASLLFQDSGGSQLASQDPTREAATNVKLLEIGVLEDRVESRLGPELAGTEISIAAEEDSNLVTVEAEAPTAAGAAAAANVYAKEYVALRRDLVRDELVAQQERIKAQIAALPNTRAGKQDQRTLTRRLRRLRLAAGDISPDVRIVRPATAPSGPSSPKPVRNTIVGLFAGLLLGLGLAVARERLDMRVRDPRFFESAVGRPILARIPRSRAFRKTAPGVELPPVEGQAFRDLRANLYWAMNGNDRSVIVTSAEPGEGKTTVVWNLACAMAGPNVKVAIVEADLRRPALSNRLGGGGGPGLTEVLEGRIPLPEAIRELAVRSGQRVGRPDMATVSALFAGSPASDPTGLLESDRMRQVIDWLVAHYDIVLIDTPPTSVASDVVPLVGRVGGVIVVGRLAKSKTGAVTEFADQMRRLGAPTLGIVVNSADFPRETYRYYYARN